MQGVCAGEMGHLEKELFLQVELYADEENDSTEIKRKKRMACAALTTWKEKGETFQGRILEAESEMRSTMNEVYNLISLYSVFEGVVLTAVATSSRLECQHLWSPVGLSLFAYCMLVVVAFTKFREIHALEENRGIFRYNMRVLVVWASLMRENGYANFNYDRDGSEVGHRIRSVPFWRNFFALIVPLTIFTTGLVFSLVHVLCWS